MLQIQKGDENLEVKRNNKRKKCKIRIILHLCIAVSYLILTLVFSFYITPLPNFIGQKYENERYNDYIFVDGKVSVIVLKYIYDMIEKIPSDIFNSFLSDSGKIYVTDKVLMSYLNNIDENETESHVSGFFRSEDISIWLSIELYAVYAGTIEHELGHYLDWKNDWISLSEEFEVLFLSEKEYFKKIVKDDYYQTKQELFAEAFGKYCVKPDTLRLYCPMIYNYIDEIIKNLNKIEINK